MTINLRKSTLYLYFSMVYLAYLVYLNIIPPLVKSAAQISFYLIAILLFCITIYIKRGKVSKVLSIPLFLLFLYGFFISLSFVANFEIVRALSFSVARAIIYFAVFYISLNIARTHDISMLIKPFVISSIVIIFLSICVFLGYKPNFYSSSEVLANDQLDINYSDGVLGFSGIFLNRNTFASSLVIAITSQCTAILTLKKQTIYKKLLYVSLFLATILLLLTASRAGILAVIIMFFLFLSKYYRSKTSIYLVLTLLVVFSFSYDYFKRNIEFLIDRFSSEGSSARVEIWADALNVFYSNPFLGAGEYFYYTVNGLKLTAHSVYMEVLVSHGLLGALPWFLWLFVGLVYVLRMYLHSKVRVYVFLASVYIAMLVHQLVESSLILPTSVWFLLFALIYGNSIKSRGI